MKITALVGLVLSAALLITGCGGHPETLSMQVRVDERKSDGKEWDWRPGIWSNLTQSIGLDLSGAPSRYPDLVLTVISEDGSMQEFVQPATETGQQDSFCEDRLTCSWTVDFPDGYYAVIVTDLDMSVSPTGVFGAIKNLLTGEPSGETPVHATSEFAGAIIVTNSWFRTDDERVANLEAMVREYLEAHGSTLGTADAIGVLKAADCDEGCTLDESETVRLTIAS